MNVTTHSTLSMDFDARSTAAKSKFIQDRVTFVERSLGNLCSTFGSIARKHSKLRDKGDELCRHLLDFSENLSYNTSSKISLAGVSRELASCSDYQDAMVRRMESHVIEPLILFNIVIKTSRMDIKNAFSAYDNEQKSKKAVERVREKNPSDRLQLSQAETALQKAHVHASQSAKKLEEAVDAFEERKLKDVKETLSNYIKIQMSYHAKCLETLTKAYNNLMITHEQEDLEEFRNVLHPSNSAERLQLMQQLGGGSKASLTSERSEASRRSQTPSYGSSPQRNLTDMFGGHTQGSNTKTKVATSTPEISGTKPQQTRSPMMGEDSEDDDDDSEDSESEDDLQPNKPVERN